jgi:hypothetical protein
MGLDRAWNTYTKAQGKQQASFAYHRQHDLYISRSTVQTYHIFNSTTEHIQQDKL